MSRVLACGLQKQQREHLLSSCGSSCCLFECGYFDADNNLCFHLKVHLLVGSARISLPVRARNLRPLYDSEPEAHLERLDHDSHPSPCSCLRWTAVFHLRTCLLPSTLPLLRCLSFQLGKVPMQEIFSRSYQVLIKPLEAMSRTLLFFF